jgi:hypothetical protein
MKNKTNVKQGMIFLGVYSISLSLILMGIVYGFYKFFN